MKLIVSSVYVAPRPGIIPIYDYAFTVAVEGEPVPAICVRFDNQQEAELARLDWMCKAGAFMPFAQVCVEQKAADSAAEVTQ